MLLLVLEEADSASEVAGAVGAGEGPLPGCMNTSMAFQPRSRPEGLAADATAVALRVCVGPAMVLKGQEIGQQFGAEGAGIEASGVGFLVVQQAAGVAIGAPALGTAEGTLLICSRWGLPSLPKHPFTPGILSWDLRGRRQDLPLTGGSCFILSSHSTSGCPGMSLREDGQLVVGLKGPVTVGAGTGLGSNVIMTEAL